ncbi:amino acid ABC transporter permease [Candidatus Bipolaricaulota bacterium]|nr:amino acid ABC transporter permease [Candidatus Bipolaricaulota bacterium]
MQAIYEQLLILWNNSPVLLEGLQVTLVLGLSFFLFGFILAIFLALGIVFGHRYLSSIFSGFSWVFRSLPAIILLFIFYYGPSRIGLEISPFLAALLALGLRHAGYQAHYFRGAIQSIGTGQLEAARSLGMSLPRGLFEIILPQMLRFSLPASANEYAITIKDTSLAFAIGVVGILQQGKYIVAREYNPLAVYITIAVIYWIITRAGTRIFAYLEDRYMVPGFDLKR